MTIKLTAPIASYDEVEEESCYHLVRRDAAGKEIGRISVRDHPSGAGLQIAPVGDVPWSDVESIRRIGVASLEHVGPVVSNIVEGE